MNNRVLCPDCGKFWKELPPADVNLLDRPRGLIEVCAGCQERRRAYAHRADTKAEETPYRRKLMKPLDEYIVPRSSGRRVNRRKLEE